MKVSDFDYELPVELIAQTPAEPRDSSRLMVLHRARGEVEHRTFKDLPGCLRPGDCLVLNDTRVMKARLLGAAEDGRPVELLLVERLDGRTWKAMGRPGKRLHPGRRVCFGDGAIRGRVSRLEPSGMLHVELEPAEELEAFMELVGEVPLPPYIKVPLEDPERYQTVFAAEKGSVAAPTAGLHFTGALLREIRDAGVRICTITLHIGPGTFVPVRTERIEEHRMHEEFFSISPEAASSVNVTRETGGRVIPVGTTPTRALESVADEQGKVRACSGRTSLFIYPGFRFRTADALLTNFHLPRSSLLMLVCAFAGREFVLRAYREAVSRRYRFYSLGDAMLIL